MSRDEFTMKFDDAEVKRILDKLGALAADVQKKHAVRAAKAAMKPVRDAARAKWLQIDDPQTAISISKNVAMHQMGKRKLRYIGADVGVSVGVKGGAKSKKGKGEKESRQWPWHWRLLEFGTSRSRAYGYMRQAAAEKIGKAQSIFTEELGKDVHQQARRR